MTPAALRLQLNNAAKGDSLRYGICVPPGTTGISVRRGLFVTKVRPGGKNDPTTVALASATTLQSTAFAAGDAYVHDAEHNLLFVNLVQRHERTNKFNYCPEEG